jgi:hypothetical protein
VCEEKQRRERERERERAHASERERDLSSGLAEGVLLQNGRLPLQQPLSTLICARRTPVPSERERASEQERGREREREGGRERERA